MSVRNHTRISLDIPNEEHRRLKAIAALRGVSMKEIILESLRRELYRNNIPNKLSEKTLKESDLGKNTKEYKDLEELRSELGI